MTKIENSQPNTKHSHLGNKKLRFKAVYYLFLNTHKLEVDDFEVKCIFLRIKLFLNIKKIIMLCLQECNYLKPDNIV